MTADDCGAVSEHGDVCVNPADHSGLCRSGVGRRHVSSPAQAGKPWRWYRAALTPEIPTSDLKESLMSIYAPPSSALIVEPVLVLVLHCSRCNKPFTEYETAGAMYWPSREVIDGAFAAAGSEYDGWVKLGDRYLCGGGCWHRTPDGGVVEEGPVRAIDDAVIVRERAGYASSTEIADVLAELGVARRAAHDLGLPHECGNCEGIDPETCLNRPRVSESHAPGGVGGAGEDASGSRLEATESAVQR